VVGDGVLRFGGVGMGVLVFFVGVSFVEPSRDLSHLSFPSKFPSPSCVLWSAVPTRLNCRKRR